MERSPREHSAPPGNVLVIAFRRALRDVVRVADQSVEYGVRFVSVFIKVLGPCLVLVALSLIGFVTYTFFVHALPDMEGGLLGHFSLSSLGLFLLVNMLYNYGMSMFMDPGTPPEYDKARTEAEAEAEELGTPAPAPRQCNQCGRVKPPRAHHCRICRRCVLKMDHHCPWINNCVGFRNYRHFCLFLLFLAASCTFIVLLFMDSFTEFFVFDRPRRGTAAGRQCILTSFMICGSILVALCMLGGFHAYLVLTNQTTIEFQMNLAKRKEARKSGEYFRNPYDLGRTRNFQQVFGPNPFWRFRWLLPWIAAPPSGDGLQFQSLSRVRI